MFSSLLLPPSQTFVRAQAESLEAFTAYYAGSRRVPGLDLPTERTLVINAGTQAGKLRELLFKLTGRDAAFYQQVRQIQPALVHAQFGLSGVLLLPLMRSLGVPLIVHYRGADATVDAKQARFDSLNHWLYYQRRDRLKQSAQLFLTVSKFIRDKLLEQGFPADRVRAHYHGVDISQFNPDASRPREAVVLFVGRLAAKKGCDDLIRAMAKVQATKADAELVLIGDGPLRASLENLASQHLQRYRFLGVQPQPVVREWMNRAQVLAAPSVTTPAGDSEGLPNVVLEAQAMQLPVVSTYHAGIPEAVIHGETGFLVKEHDWQGLADYLLKLLQAQDLWQHFSQQGRSHMENNFNRYRQTRALEQIYEAVLAQKSERSLKATG
ncbi:glycosyltransferase [Almyronema epifaneia]|uniref:Glycosyltransferase n=1 Tax=Almyronema epifaneia S1 TaxID=2991925 RepID=A0ABW6IBA5_9CYAN